jgi:DNA-binding response OmpR family regulator
MHTNVIVVDVEPSVVAKFAAPLRRAGYAPSAAHSFQDAVRLLIASEPAVLVVSLELGAYNGLHLLLRSSVETPSTKVIVVGPANSSLENEARALGASAYLPRPVTAAALVEQVQTLTCTPPAVMTMAIGAGAPAA